MGVRRYRRGLISPTAAPHRGGFISESYMDTQIVRVPLPQWEEMAAQSSTKALAESNGQGIVSVRNARFRGRPIMISGILYGGLEGAAIYGWWLVPESDYTAPLPITHVYHDPEAIIAGTRKRGDLRGLKVRWSGEILIVQSKVQVHPELPKVLLGLAEAQAEDAKLRREGGWRVSITKREVPPVWWTLRGHPVVEYRGRFEQRLFALYYRSGAGVGSIGISEEGEYAKQLIEAEPSSQSALPLGPLLPQQPVVEAQLDFQF